MDRWIAYVVALIVVCLALPTIASFAVELIPLLFGALLFLVAWKLFWPV